MIAFFNAKDQYKQVEEAPAIVLHYMECPDESGLQIDLYKSGERRDLEDLFNKSRSGDKINLDGKSCVRIGGFRMVLNFIFDDLPMFSYSYMELEDAFRRYFGNASSG